MFPIFLLVSGAALGVALRQRPGVHRALVRRAAALFALGLVLNALPWPGWADLRIMGVLQRIALATLLAALVLLHLRTRRVVALAVAVLVGNTVVLMAGGSPARAPSTNWPKQIDSALLGLGHLYSADRGDPEGLASTPAVMVSVLLCAGSGVLALAGLSALADSSARWIIGQPWEALGRNALVVYVGSELTIAVLRATNLREGLYRTVFEPVGGARGGSLLYALSVLLAWWLVCVVLWRRRTFVTV